MALGAGLGIGWLKSTSASDLDRFASARMLWRQIEPRRAEVCLAGVKRDWEYGLAYYAGAPLPACNADPKPLEVAPGPGNRVIVRARTAP